MCLADSTPCRLFIGRVHVSAGCCEQAWSVWKQRYRKDVSCQVAQAVLSQDLWCVTVAFSNHSPVCMLDTKKVEMHGSCAPPQVEAVTLSALLHADTLLECIAPENTGFGDP